MVCATGKPCTPHVKACQHPDYGCGLTWVQLIGDLVGWLDQQFGLLMASPNTGSIILGLFQVRLALAPKAGR